jgi:DNA polymerase III sliding clamp (beta) subunit (PCNA family)
VTKVTFETATLADAIRKASQVAPSRGAAFDKAAGVVIEVTPGNPIPVVVKATDTEVYYMEWVDSVEVEGAPVQWRLPAKVFAGFVTALPIGSGKRVTLEEIAVNETVMLQLTQDRKKAKFNLMRSEYYPLWTVFDPDPLEIVPDIGGKLAMVDWTTAKDDPGVLAGVHLTGSSAVATDKYRFACVPLELNLDEPVTVPVSVLTQIMKRTGEVRMGINEGQLQVMPDETTQIRAILYDQEYPKVDGIMRRDQPNQLTFKKSQLLEAVGLAMNFIGSDRSPILNIFVGKETIAVYMAGADTGNMGDVIEVPGQATHERITLLFTPKNLIQALENAPNEEVTLNYDLVNIRRPVRIDGGSGYEAWVAMRTMVEKANG